MKVEIDYDPAVENDFAKHTSWEQVVDKYCALSIGHEKKGKEGTSTLFFPEKIDLETLAEELSPIKIIS